MIFPWSVSAFLEMELILKNAIEEIPPAADEVNVFLEGHGAGPDVLYVSRLAIEELVSNTIKYGYDDPGSHDIHIDARIENNAMVLAISDDGHPFDPLEAPEPDTSLPAEERPIGGLGIFLVRNMTDSFQYERRDGRNIVTISKRLNAEE